MSVRVVNRLEARAAVLLATNVIADDKAVHTDDVVEALGVLQYAPLAAERLALLVPLAFGRVTLKSMGVEHYAWTVRIDADDDVILQHDLRTDPIFIEALRHAVESFESEGAARAKFDRVSEDSPEVGAARKAQAADQDVRQARIHETVWRSQLPSDEWRALGAVEQAPIELPEA